MMRLQADDPASTYKQRSRIIPCDRQRNNLGCPLRLLAWSSRVPGCRFHRYPLSIRIVVCIFLLGRIESCSDVAVERNRPDADSKANSVGPDCSLHLAVGIIMASRGGFVEVTPKKVAAIDAMPSLRQAGRHSAY